MPQKHRMGERSGTPALSRFVVPLARSRRASEAWLNQSRETPGSTPCSDNNVTAASGQYMDHPPKVAKGLLMIPAGRQCSFWSSDGALGNRPVPPPALPISPDIAPQEARSAVRLGSFGGLATSRPSGQT